MRWLGVVLACLLVPVSLSGSYAQAQTKPPEAPPPGAKPASAPPPLMLQHPSLSASLIAFDYGGQIWTVPRAGGQATLLVAGQGQNSGPVFSPDGSLVAYTGTYDGNTDVYVVPAGGGQPQRLTWHPGRDVAVGWTPDGKNVLFRTPRTTPRDLEQLYTIPVTGGAATQLPLPSGFQASYSPDGGRLAYVPFSQWQPAWKHYRGGQTSRVWIAALSDSSVVKIPRDNSNDRNPLWVGDTVYFLSDREGPVALYAYDVKTAKVTSVVRNERGFDIQSAAAGPGGIVYDQFGTLNLYDTATRQAHAVPVTISGELPQTRAHLETLDPGQILHAALSPTGKRVLFETHGEILSVPAEKGDVRNLTQSPGVADRDPAWSPDGKTVAWFSDQGGEYALHLRSADGLGPVKVIGLGQPPSYFYGPLWSPDSKKIAYTDKRLNLWVVDVDHPTPVKVDTDRYDSPASQLNPAWSPDSRWIAYAKQLPNHLHGIYVYSLADKKTQMVTDGRSNATSPRFDRGGKYLYFVAFTNNGLDQGWLDMSSMGRATDGRVYVMVLRRDLPSPLAPESDEEAAADGKKSGQDDGDKKADDKKGDGKKVAEVRIDFAGLDQRTLALPIPRVNLAGIDVGTEGIVFAAAQPVALTDEDYLDGDENSPPSLEVARFDLKTRKTDKFVDGVDAGSFFVSADGRKVLYAQHGRWFVNGADKAPDAGAGALKLDEMQVWVDPRAEWRQMYHEAWRIERDFLYDPKAQGLDLAKAEQVYAPFLEALAGRVDLNTLFAEMTGHIGLGHTFVGGGAFPKQDKVSVGLLGVDYRVVAGRYQFARILEGENWTPGARAPLTQPGVNVAVGDLLLAVNDNEVKTDQEVYRYFLGTAGKQTVLTVGPKADGSGSRQVTVVPLPSETKLRLHTWMEENRRKVDQLSGGRLAYVYLPDTAAGGFANFNRYYYSQVGKQGAIVDERFNHGGQIADFIVEQMKKTPQMIDATREGEEMVEPAQAIYGPKVMIINQMSGSGGDALPWLFRKAKLGTLVGVRTWGGLVGIGGYPPLMDGGSITAPRWALYGTHGEWEVENIGIPPDVEVEQDPALVRQGHDPQLEKAVAVALDQLAKNPPQTFTRPAYPDRKPVLPETGR
ncbi:S41 family peptidase [Nitrospirillum viridazoti]|uniref:Tricorn protease homolog n=1 Tax=Nitrospirillum amazonense TaxID=28077 RepID=A0A560IGU4_9PROT|nr:S41 family peptidase [Nitrospirillum amazonense]TWB56030.1 tricorn protease [Nitrospirillum amazonense]